MTSSPYTDTELIALARAATPGPTEDLIQRLNKRRAMRLYSQRGPDFWVYSVDESQPDPICVEAANTITALEAERDSLKKMLDVQSQATAEIVKANIEERDLRLTEYFDDRETIAALEGQNKELREALKPFKDEAERRPWLDKASPSQNIGGSYIINADLSRAAKAGEK